MNSKSDLESGSTYTLDNRDIKLTHVQNTAKET